MIQTHRNISPGHRSRVWARSMEIWLILKEWLYWELQRNKWGGKAGHRSWEKMLQIYSWFKKEKEKKRGKSERGEQAFPNMWSEVGWEQGFNSLMENSLPQWTIFVMYKFSRGHARYVCLWSRFDFGDNSQKKKSSCPVLLMCRLETPSVTTHVLMQVVNTNGIGLW